MTNDALKKRHDDTDNNEILWRNTYKKFLKMIYIKTANSKSEYKKEYRRF